MSNTQELEEMLRKTFIPIGIKQKDFTDEAVTAVEEYFNNPPSSDDENDMPVYSNEECMEAHRLTLLSQGKLTEETWEL